MAAHRIKVTVEFETGSVGSMSLEDAKQAVLKLLVEGLQKITTFERRIVNVSAEPLHGEQIDLSRSTQVK